MSTDFMSTDFMSTGFIGRREAVRQAWKVWKGLDLRTRAGSNNNALDGCINE